MAEDFRLDPEAFHRVTSDVRSTGSAMEDAVRALESVLTDHDGCWGTDDIGSSFAKKYVDDAKKVRGYNQDAADGFGTYADNADNMADQFQELDAGNASSVEREYYDHEAAQDIKNPPPQQ